MHKCRLLTVKGLLPLLLGEPPEGPAYPNSSQEGLCPWSVDGAGSGLKRLSLGLPLETKKWDRSEVGRKFQNRKWLGPTLSPANLSKKSLYIPHGPPLPQNSLGNKEVIKPRHTF